MNNEKLKTQMMSGMVWKFGERFIAQGVSFFVSLILARILMPDEYGVIAIITIFISIADVLLSSGLNTALIQKQDADEIDFSTIFYCNLILGSILYIVLFLIAPFLAAQYHLPVLCNAIRVFALRLPISSFQSIQTAYVSRRMDFKKFFFSTITGTVASAFVGVIMALKGFGVYALIGQYLTNTVVDTLFLFVTVRWRPRLVFSWDRAKPMIKYGIRVMCTDLIGTIFNNLGDFLIGLKYTTTDLAYYNKGRQLPNMFKNNLTTTLVSVLFPGMSKASDDMERVKVITRRSIRMLTYIVYPLMIGLFVVAELLTVVLYTSKWIAIVPYVQVLCVEAIFSVPSTITLQTIKAVGRSDLMLKSEFIKKPLLLISLLIAIRYGVFAIALILPINTFMEMLINSYLTKITVNYSLKNVLIDCSSAFFMSFIMGGVVFFISRIDLHIDLVLLLVCVLVGMAVYAGLSLLMKNSEFYTLFTYVRGRIKKENETA